MKLFLQTLFALAFLVLGLCLPSRGQTSLIHPIGVFPPEHNRKQSGYDTIKVMMICIDTTVYPSFYSDTLEYISSPKSFWLYGYSVRKIFVDYGFYGFMGSEYEHEYYLNEDKKPLKKQIIVFISKEIP